MGIVPNNPHTYIVIVHNDDFAGCEMGSRSIAAFNTLGQLLADLGVQESVDKASKPSTQMKFLGVEFDTISLCMRNHDTTLQEITMLSKFWAQKTVATKQELQLEMLHYVVIDAGMRKKWSPLSVDSMTKKPMLLSLWPGA